MIPLVDNKNVLVPVPLGCAFSSEGLREICRMGDPDRALHLQTIHLVGQFHDLSPMPSGSFLV